MTPCPTPEHTSASMWQMPACHNFDALKHDSDQTPHYVHFLITRTGHFWTEEKSHIEIFDIWYHDLIG